MRRPSGTTLVAVACAALLVVSVREPGAPRRAAHRPRLADLDRPPRGPDPHQHGQVAGRAAAPLLRRGSERRVPPVLPEPLGHAAEPRRRAARHSGHDGPGRPLRPARGRCVPLVQLPGARPRAARPPRGARRERRACARRQRCLRRSARPGVGLVAEHGPPRALPRDLARDVAEPRLGAVPPRALPRLSRLPRVHTGARARRRPAAGSALLLAHAHVRERGGRDARLRSSPRTRPSARATGRFKTWLAGARAPGRRVRGARRDAADGFVREPGRARSFGTSRDLLDRPQQALLPLGLPAGRDPGAAVRSPPGEAPHDARGHAGRLEPGSDDGGGNRRRGALFLRLRSRPRRSPTGGRATARSWPG